MLNCNSIKITIKTLSVILIICFLSFVFWFIYDSLPNLENQYNNYYSFDKHSDYLGQLGTIGDFVGGLLNPVFGALTMILAFMTVYYTRQTLQITNEALSEQKALNDKLLKHSSQTLSATQKSLTEQQTSNKVMALDSNFNRIIGRLIKEQEMFDKKVSEECQHHRKDTKHLIAPVKLLTFLEITKLLTEKFPRELQLHRAEELSNPRYNFPVDFTPASKYIDKFIKTVSYIESHFVTHTNASDINQSGNHNSSIQCSSYIDSLFILLPQEAIDLLFFYSLPMIHLCYTRFDSKQRKDQINVSNSPLAIQIKALQDIIYRYKTLKYLSFDVRDYRHLYYEADLYYSNIQEQLK